MEHRRHRSERAYLYAAGRSLLAAAFLVGGLLKAVHLSEVAQVLREDGIPDARLLAMTAVLIELAGGTMVILGLAARAAAKGLIAYLAAVTVIVLMDGFSGLNGWVVLANLAFAGALLMIVAYGPGPFSLTHLFHKHGWSSPS
jgi:putative oxidoreductase